VKDNIDVAGLPTTAACPAFSDTPASDAPAVARLRAAGAICLGKVNLDQFATGLVGTRSPYGVPVNPFDARYPTGGSSSGSAAAVARGLVCFALGTDTAGSGRVPAGLTNTVGWKPSRGLVSTRGVVPACRSLDCVTVFALTVEDARLAARILVAFDEQDPYARSAPEDLWRSGNALPRTLAIPRAADLSFLGDEQAARAFADACALWRSWGVALEEIDLGPFKKAGKMLYDGAFIGERLSELEAFVDSRPEALLPVTRGILAQGKQVSGARAFRDLHALAALSREVSAVWKDADALLLPTTPTIFTIEQIEADPVLRNSELGLYTNFGNLLDLAGVAVPNGFRADGLPTGVMLMGPWGSDGQLLAWADRWQRARGGRLGATNLTLAPAPEAVTSTARPEPRTMRLAVVGAHLSGEPLNGQLTSLGGRLVRACQTAARYRLYRLPNTTPPKPGLVHVGEGEGHPIAVEVWQIPEAALGAFFPNVVAPLCLGTLELDDGERVPGFVCEPRALVGAEDISSFGGWKAYRASRRA